MLAAPDKKPIAGLGLNTFSHAAQVQMTASQVSGNTLTFTRLDNSAGGTVKDQTSDLSVGGEIVINYNSGQVSAFAYGGAQGGWNGGASASVYSGYVYGLDNSNGNYARGSSGFNDVACRLNPYPAHYRPAFACSLLPYPPSLRLLLRVAFQHAIRWGDDGLTTFRRCHRVG